jgi:hypothetical protein
MFTVLATSNVVENTHVNYREEYPNGPVLALNCILCRFRKDLMVWMTRALCWLTEHLVTHPLNSNSVSRLSGHQVSVKRIPHSGISCTIDWLRFVTIVSSLEQWASMKHFGWKLFLYSGGWLTLWGEFCLIIYSSLWVSVSWPHSFSDALPY